MRVLVASNDMTFCPSLSLAYRARGHEVVAGVPNFELKLGDYDLVHLHWPEELVGFASGSATPAKTGPALALLDWWSRRSVLVATVHNLVPHSARTVNGPEAAYFNEYYQRVDLICHFSEYSRTRYAEQYPSLDPDKQVVHALNDFDHLRPLARGRAASRAALGLPPTGPVFGVIGALRTSEELHLVQEAWRKAGLADVHLLFCSARPPSGRPAMFRFLDQMAHRRWLRDPHIHVPGSRLPDSELVQVVEACDAIIIPRFGNHLNSGIVPLALTFGTAVIAPANGANRELLTGSPNLLYAPGDADALATGIKTFAARDAEIVREQNRRLSASFGWHRILDQIWPRVEQLSAIKRQLTA